MKKRLWTLCLAAVTALCLCLGLAACGKSKAFSAPTNLALEGSTLVWDAVEGAEGYTVKIGDDETTTTAATLLNLDTVTDKLVEGENTISVKANATKKKKASAYSEPITYTYTPAPVKSPLATPTGVKVEEDTLSWNAVEGATAGYTVKIGTDETTKVTSGTSLDLATASAIKLGENTVAVKANETATSLASNYSEPVTYTHRTAFTAPTASMDADGHTLKWTAVTDATSYTVKISATGAEDKTITVNAPATSLDLSGAEVAAQLTKNEVNKLSVKANENTAKYRTESAYSNEVEYTYQPTPQEEAESYAALVDLIDENFSAESDHDALVAIEKAIKDAEDAEKVLSSAAKALGTYTTAQGKFTARKQNYESVKQTAQDLLAPFQNAVTAAMQTIEAAASIETLAENKTTADEAYADLTTLAKALAEDVENLNSNYESIGSTLATWNTNVINEWRILNEVNVDALFVDDEDFYAAATSALDGYSALAAYIKADADITALQAKIQAKLTEVTERLEEIASTLKTDIGNTLQESDIGTVSEANYKKLLDLQNRVEALGAYAREKFLTDIGQANENLNAAIKNMLADKFKTVTSETIIYNNDNNDTPTFVIIRKSVNVAGDGVDDSEIALTDTDVTAWETVTGSKENAKDKDRTQITGITVTHDTENKAYIITIPFTRLDYDGGAGSGTVALEYKIKEEGEKTLTLASPRYIYYFDTANNEAPYNQEGNLNIAGGFNKEGMTDEDILIDIYRAGDVVKGARTDSVSFKNVPIASENKTTVGSLGDLRSALAAAGVKGDITVQLFVHERYEEGDATYFTAANSASVSAELTLTGIKPEEVKKMVKLNLIGHKWDLGTDDGNIGYSVEVFDADQTYHDGAYIYVYDATGHEDDLQTYDFTTERPFAIYHIAVRESVGWKKAYGVNKENIPIDDVITAEWIRRVRSNGAPQSFEDITTPTKYTFVFGMQAKVNEAGIEAGYRDSEIVFATIKDGEKQGERASKQYTFTEESVAATSDIQVNFNTTGYFLLLRSTEFGNGYIFTQKHASYVEMTLTKDEDSYTVYIFADAGENNIVEDGDSLYINTEVGVKEGAQGCGTVGNGYVELGTFNTWMNTAFSITEFNATEWSVTTKIFVEKTKGSACLWLLDGPVSDPTTNEEQVVG